MKQTRQAIQAFKQSTFLSCLWLCHSVSIVPDKVLWHDPRGDQFQKLQTWFMTLTQRFLQPIQKCKWFSICPSYSCSEIIVSTPLSGNAHWKGKISTVDLLVVTTSNQLPFALKKYFFSLTKQAILTRKWIVLSHPLH